MKSKTLITLSVALAITAFCLTSYAQVQGFRMRTVSPNEFYKFVKVFSEMRGPLRKAILADRNTDFENADPLNYVMKVKDEKDVRKMIKKSGLTWDAYVEMMGNILLGYFSIQPQRTKASLIKQLSDYGLVMANDQIPPEYRQAVSDALKTDEGATLAGMALDFIIQIPPENVALARDNEKQLDQLFYTRFWRDKLE